LGRPVRRVQELDAREDDARTTTPHRPHRRGNGRTTADRSRAAGRGAHDALPMPAIRPALHRAVHIDGRPGRALHLDPRLSAQLPVPRVASPGRATLDAAADRVRGPDRRERRLLAGRHGTLGDVGLAGSHGPGGWPSPIGWPSPGGGRRAFGCPDARQGGGSRERRRRFRPARDGRSRPVPASPLEAAQPLQAAGDAPTASDKGVYRLTGATHFSTGLMRCVASVRL